MSHYREDESRKKRWKTIGSVLGGFMVGSYFVVMVTKSVPDLLAAVIGAIIVLGVVAALTLIGFMLDRSLDL